MGKIVLQLADGTTLDVFLNKERITIGRRADNDVCLPHPAVSGEHASVVTILADSFLEDLGSTNGTLVNGKPIVKHFLRDNDQIDIGRQRMVFMSDDKAHVDPLPPDIARNQLMGLTNRVDGVHPAPKAAMPSIANLGTSVVNHSRLANLDLDDELEPEPPPAAVPRRESVAEFPDGRSPAAAGAPGNRPEAGGVGGGVGRAERQCRRGPDRHGGRTGWRNTNRHRVQGNWRHARRRRQNRRPPEPSVRVLSGPNLGRAVAFTKNELSVGRVGVQVAVVRKEGTGFRLVPVEGAQPPRINGTPVAPEGAALHPGDTFEVAGVRLELSLAG